MKIRRKYQSDPTDQIHNLRYARTSSPSFSLWVGRCLSFTTFSDVPSRCRLQRNLVLAILSLSIRAQTTPPLRSTPLTHRNQSADDSKGMRGRKFRQVTSLFPHGDNLETSPRGTAHCTHDSNMGVRLYLCICVLSTHSFE